MRKFPLKDFTEPKHGGHMIYVDSWWPVTENDEIFFFGPDRSPYAAPQCNLHQVIAERQVENKYVVEAADGAKVEARQLPVVFVPINWSDYHD